VVAAAVAAVAVVEEEEAQGHFAADLEIVEIDSLEEVGHTAAGAVDTAVPAADVGEGIAAVACNLVVPVSVLERRTPLQAAVDSAMGSVLQTAEAGIPDEGFVELPNTPYSHHGSRGRVTNLRPRYVPQPPHSESSACLRRSSTSSSNFLP
jgi:hypothetical protein